MSIETKVRLVESLWNDLCDTQFTIKDLSAAIISDCSIDARGVVSTDLEQLCLGHAERRLDEMASALDDVLAFYLAGEMKNAEFVKSIFVSLLLGHLINKGHGDWFFSFDKIMDLICRNRYRGNAAFRMSVLKEILIPE